jgi:hypothetical protein
MVGSSSRAVPCANGCKIDKRLSLPISKIPERYNLAIACNSLAHPTIPRSAEKKAELKAPHRIK